MTAKFRPMEIDPCSDPELRGNQRAPLLHAAARARRRNGRRSGCRRGDAQELNRLPISGTSSSAKASATKHRCSILAKGSELAQGPAVDIALDPLEGTTICAKNLPNSLAVIAVAEKGISSRT